MEEENQNIFDVQHLGNGMSHPYPYIADSLGGDAETYEIIAKENELKQIGEMRIRTLETIIQDKV